MSFGAKLAPRECRIDVGGVYSNGLAGRFEEHRRVTKIEDVHLEFEVVFGRRIGNVGSCQVTSFWLWSRAVVEK